MTSATRPKKHGRQIVMIDREAEENGNETSPLLGAGADDESEGSSEGEWVAVTDFDHLPWWRRPSVCDVSRPPGNVGTTPTVVELSCDEQSRR